MCNGRTAKQPADSARATLRRLAFSGRAERQKGILKRGRLRDVRGSCADVMPPTRDLVSPDPRVVPRSFASLFESLARAGLVHFACDNFFDTERYEIEFFVALKASDDQQQIVNSWAAMKSATTTSVPHIAASSSMSLADLLELEQSRNLALLRKLETAQRTIQDLRDSTSWRVTGPLRSLGSTLRRKRQRA